MFQPQAALHHTKVRVPSSELSPSREHTLYPSRSQTLTAHQLVEATLSSSHLSHWSSLYSAVTALLVSQSIVTCQLLAVHRPTPAPVLSQFYSPSKAPRWSRP